jgi:hypothetical protein
MKCETKKERETMRAFWSRIAAEQSERMARVLRAEAEKGVRRALEKLARDARGTW